MSLISRFQFFSLSLLLSGAASSVFAGSPSTPSNCDKIAQDVRESVTKEPSKVLMIVEDALVISESCACEIVKAAITASHADVPMVKQIVQTAIAVAPKMTPVIVECANLVSPGAVNVADKPAVVAKRSGKDAKNVLPEPIQPPKETTVSFSGPVNEIRGVYLMAPAVGGIITQDEEPTPQGQREKPRKVTHRKTDVTPLSPSDDQCVCP